VTTYRQKGCRTGTASFRCAKTSSPSPITLYFSQPRIFVMQPIGALNVGLLYTLRPRYTCPFPLQKT
jgi:hypothetical protein